MNDIRAWEHVCVCVLVYIGENAVILLESV